MRFLLRFWLLRDFYDWDLSEKVQKFGLPATWHNFAQLHLSVCPGHEARKGLAQATGPLRARSAHQKIRECVVCPLVFLGTINDEDCDLQGPSSVADWLAGWPPFWAALQPRS